MHPYSTTDSRIRVYSAIAVVAVACAWSMDWLTSSLDWPRWLAGVPSFVAFFGIIYGVFDRWLWKTRVSRVLRLSVLPDVSGTLRGRLVSTFRTEIAKPSKHDVTVQIRQTWTRIEIRLEVDHSMSSSISLMAALKGDMTSSVLTYHFRNQIQPGRADDDMSDHEGVAELRIDTHGIRGRYFNSRGNSGSLTLDQAD